MESWAAWTRTVSLPSAQAHRVPWPPQRRRCDSDQPSDQARFREHFDVKLTSDLTLRLALANNVDAPDNVLTRRMHHAERGRELQPSDQSVARSASGSGEELAHQQR